MEKELITIREESTGSLTVHSLLMDFIDEHTDINTDTMTNAELSAAVHYVNNVIPTILNK